MNSASSLPSGFYGRDPRVVAYELLGKLIVRQRDGLNQQIGRIIETEAYLGPHDLAAHSAKGLTARTKVMFGPAGHAYVYLIYGLHHCLNVVTQAEGQASAVLIRALEPISGIDLPCHGPGRLCKALNITRELNGCDLNGPDLWLADAPAIAHEDIIYGPRIGIDYAGQWVKAPLRYCIAGHPKLSRKAG